MNANHILLRGKRQPYAVASRRISQLSYSRFTRKTHIRWKRRFKHDIGGFLAELLHPQTKTNLDRYLCTTASNPLIGSLGSLSIEEIDDAEHKLLAAVSQRNKIGFERATSLLVRLAEEQAQIQTQNGKVGKYEEGKQSNNYAVEPFLLNQVIDCWRTCWRDHMIDISPTDILKLIDTLESNGVIPDSRTLTLVIDGITLRGDQNEAPLLAQWLLDQRMELADRNPELRPDTVMITNVIRAWGKSNRIEAPEMAEGLLQLMHDLYESGEWIDSGPNTLSYSVTMEAWANSKSTEASEKMECLLDEMKQSSVEAVRPDRVSYLYVINSWAHSKSPTGPDRANSLLQEMLQLYTNGNDDVAPDTSIFSQIMVAYARRGRTEEVEQLHEQLQEVYSTTGGDPRFKPNSECAKALIIALTKKGSQAEAEGILDELVERAILEQDTRAMPKRSYFVDILVAWTKDHNTKRAADQSQKILMRLLDLSKSGYPELMPDSKCFEKVMQAWSKTNSPKAASSVDSLLATMKKEYAKTQLEAIKPSIRTFELVLLTWSRSRHSEAPDRAEALMAEMEGLYSKGDPSMRPSRGAYTTLMLTWQRSRRKKAPSMVLEVFDDMQRKFQNGESHLRPDAYVFSVVMDSFAQQGDITGAQSIFDTMLDEYSSGNEEAKPDIESFNKLLRAYSFSRDKGKAQKAEKLFQSMKSLGLGLSPNRQTLIEMISVWSFSKDSRAAKKCEQYFANLKRNNYEVTVATYSNVIDALNKSKDPTAADRAKKLLETLLQEAEAGFVQQPFFNPYKKFLQTVSRSKIPRRNEQARKLLQSLNSKVQIPRNLLPSI